MGVALTPIPFWSDEIEIGTVESASREEFFKYGRRCMQLRYIGQGSLYQYDDEPCHYLYKFVDGEWFEFMEAA